MQTPPVWRGAPRLAALILSLVVLLGACSGTEEEPAAAGPELVGPLCDLLPQPGTPGGPETLTGETADIALTWIPVLTNVEAGARAAGLDAVLADVDAVTILAPTDDAITAAMSQDTIDQLLLFRQDEMGDLLEAHMISGRMSLQEMIDAGSVTTLDGDTVTVEPSGNMARFDDRSETVCAGYETANATIHVIDGVLGDIPEPSEDEGPGGG